MERPSRSRLAPAGRGLLLTIVCAGVALALLAAPRSASALSAHIAYSAAGDTTLDVFGRSVALAGDVNGDGYPDVVAGAPYNDVGGPSAGAAYVYYGGPAADSLADLVLFGSAAEGVFFGWSVAGAGDVNGDGYGDILVGAPGAGTPLAREGRAYLFLGGASPDAVADAVYSGQGANDQFAYAIAGAGDVNGDGYADVVIGAPFNGGGGEYAGRAYVYFGGAVPDTTIDVLPVGEQGGEEFGCAVGGGGDVNGDGFDDVIVGAFLNSSTGDLAGKAYVFYGGMSPSTTADLTTSGEADGDGLGAAVASAGDVNGDGYADVLIGAPLSDAAALNAGRAYVVFGGAAADGTPDVVLTGAVGGDQFGYAVASAGDANDDGRADVVVGAPFSSAGLTNTGRAYLFLGGVTGDVAATDADVILHGAATKDYFGTALSGAGDRDGDGFADLAIGATGADAGGSGAGAVSFALVYPYQVLAPAAGDSVAVGDDLTITWRGHDLADVELSLDGGTTWQPLFTSIGGADLNTTMLVVPEPPSDDARLRVSYTGQGAAPGTYAVSGAFRILPATDARDVLDETAALVPGLAVHPSPARHGTPLRVTLRAPAVDGWSARDVDLGLFDVRGRRVATVDLADADARDGTLALAWTPRREAGDGVAPGVYFLRVRIERLHFTTSRRIVLR